ncbi:MAG: hypothetical protein JXP34_27010 [Planctomycetes bacterium]|nr:hypothetical protein [Planctomycetota bacterium]
MDSIEREIDAHVREVERTNQRGGRMLSIVDLIERGTLDLELAAILAAEIARGASFLIGASPGGAGKTTVAGALLGFLPAGVPIVAATPGLAGRALRASSPRTCFLAHEIGDGPYFAYLWGRDAAEFVELPAAGHIAVANLHADDPDEVFDQLCRACGARRPSLERFLMIFLRIEGTALRPVRRIDTVWGPGPERIAAWDPRRAAFRLEGSAPPGADGFRALIEPLCREGIRAIGEVRRAVLRAAREGDREGPR